MSARPLGTRRPNAQTAWLLGALLATSVSGCASGVVGGSCADGYELCGNQCVLLGSCERLPDGGTVVKDAFGDGSARDGDAPDPWLEDVDGFDSPNRRDGDAADGTAVDGLVDGLLPDGARPDGTLPDGAPIGDGTLPDGAPIGDGTLPDGAPIGDGTLPDGAPIGDGTLPDGAPIGDGTLPDGAPIGDGTLPDGAPIGDGTLPDGAPIGDGTFGDGTLPDGAPIGDGSFGDGTLPDGAPIGDGSFGDGTLPDGAPIGDGSFGDGTLPDGAPIGDGSFGDGTLPDGAPIGDGAASDSFDPDAVASDAVGLDSGPVDTCAPPYSTPENCGACGHACVRPTPVCAPVNPAEAGVDAGDFFCDQRCHDPFTECRGQCVDLQIDPYNCGFCGHVCPTFLCNGGKCVGAVTGHVVVIGHDYVGTTSGSGTPAASIAVNALLPAGLPNIKIVAFEKYASTSAITRVKSILNGSGRTNFTYTTETPDFAALKDDLRVDRYQVVLVYDQVTAPTGVLGTEGALLAGAFDSFTKSGGIVVVLDGGAGFSQMPDFLTQSGLLQVSHDRVGLPLTSILGVTPAGAGDSIGIFVRSPYSAPSRTVSFAVAEFPAPVFVVAEGEKAPYGSPIVVHKVVVP